MRTMKLLVLAVLVTSCATVSVAQQTAAQQVDADSLQRRAIERRGTEAVIWGMPAVNADLMLQEMLAKTTAKQNDVVFWSRPADAKNQTLTPNPDSIYFMCFWNVKVGPIVIDVPPLHTWFKGVW